VLLVSGTYVSGFEKRDHFAKFDSFQHIITSRALGFSLGL